MVLTTICQKMGGSYQRPKARYNFSSRYVRKPKILLLDEPTSSMDQTTERQVIENLKKYFSYQTVLLVTHRMSLLKMVDRVIAVDEGKITVDGKKDDILAKLKGFS